MTKFQLLPLLLAIVCYPVCGVINFKIYVSFPIKPFSYMNENSEQKPEISKERREFLG